MKLSPRFQDVVCRVLGHGVTATLSTPFYVYVVTKLYSSHKLAVVKCKVP